MNAHRLVATLPLLALLSGAACSSKTAAELLVSPEEENMLGAAIKAELETKQMVRYLQDPQLRSYVLGLADKVVALGRMQRPEFTWNVEVIDDPNQVNAFATPGGYLYVFTGLLRAAEDEAEVIGVMGHEVAHVLARHYARALVKTYGLQAIIAVALGQNPSLLTELATLAAQGYLLKHSRAAETEADEIGARLAHQAGYDPAGLVSFFAKLDELQGGRAPAVLTYLMSHPQPGDRSRHVMQLIGQERLTGGARNRETFQQMRAKLPAGLPMGGAPPPAGSADAGRRD